MENKLGGGGDGGIYDMTFRQSGKMSQKIITVCMKIKNGNKRLAYMNYYKYNNNNVWMNVEQCMRRCATVRVQNFTSKTQKVWDS